MKSFYPKGNWVKWKSRIEESVESLIKWAFEKTVNKSWQNRWASNLNFIKILRTLETAWFQRFLRLWGVEMGKIKITVFAEKLVKIWYESW